MDLRDTSITSISSIVDTLHLSKIGLTLDFRELLQIKNMKNLKVLFCNTLNETEANILREHKPDLKISKEDFNIAWPDQCYQYMDGFWDIEIKQEPEKRYSA